MMMEDILDLSAGPKLDYLIWKIVFNGKRKDHLPLFSTDIRAAWEVAEKVGICLIPQSRPDGGFDWLACDVERVLYGDEIKVFEKKGSAISAESAPMAICKAALLSLMEQDVVYD